jgi:hypothetical protein
VESQVGSLIDVALQVGGAGEGAEGDADGGVLDPRWR